jgi:hypothetical protein
MLALLPSFATTLLVNSNASDRYSLGLLGSWVFDLPRDALEITKGHVGGAYLEKTLDLVDRLQLAGFQIPLNPTSTART